MRRSACSQPTRRGTARPANVPIVSGFKLWYPKDKRQHTLWPSFVELSEKYYETLIRHAVPLDHRAIAALQHNALSNACKHTSRNCTRLAGPGGQRAEARTQEASKYQEGC